MPPLGAPAAPATARWATTCLVPSENQAAPAPATSSSAATTITAGDEAADTAGTRVCAFAGVGRPVAAGLGRFDDAEPSVAAPHEVQKLTPGARPTPHCVQKTCWLTVISFRWGASGLAPGDAVEVLAADRV